MNSLSPDTGIPEGLRISIGGHIRVADEMGGTMTIDYETFRLRGGEAFLVFVDSKEVLRVTAGRRLDRDGYSHLNSNSTTIKLDRGERKI